MTDAAQTQTRTIVMERTLAHPPEKVWRALTESELMARWLMPNDFQPVAGHAFDLRAQPQPGWSGITHCQVLEIEPPRRLVYTWGDGSETANGLKTVVTWTLAPVAAGTHVRMEHSGFGPADERNYRGAEFGWNRMLEGLAAVVAELG
jgi:uncharacterized protein YndB with AHSA1/START domain